MSWFKKKAPPVDLTNEAYGRWIRAARPQPIQWFLAQDETVQECLAKIGDEYVEEVSIAIGYAVQNPRAAEAGLDADTNVESEEQLVKQIAEAMAEKITGAIPKPRSDILPPDLTFGGLTARKGQRQQDEARAKSVDLSFMGRKPDESVANGTTDQA